MEEGASWCCIPVIGKAEAQPTSKWGDGPRSRLQRIEHHFKEGAPEVAAFASFARTQKAPMPLTMRDELLTMHDESPDPETNVDIVLIAASTKKPSATAVKERPTRTTGLGLHADIEDRILASLLQVPPVKAAIILSQQPRRFQRFVATFLRSDPMKVWDIARHKISTCAFPKQFFEVILEQEENCEQKARQRMHDLFWPDVGRRKQLVSVFS